MLKVGFVPINLSKSKMIGGQVISYQALKGHIPVLSSLASIGGSTYA